MRILRSILFLALLLLAPGLAHADGPGDAARDPDAMKRARERWESLTPEQRHQLLEAFDRWKQLTPEERAQRRKLFEEFLKGTTDRERHELLDRLRRVRERKDLEELRRKRERLHRIAEQFEKGLPDATKAELDALPEERRQVILVWAVARLSEVFRERWLAGLSDREKASLEGLTGSDRAKQMQQIRLARALARLDPKERARLEGLPEPEKRAQVLRVVHRMHEADLEAARQAVGAELGRLLKLPEEKLLVRLRMPRVAAALRGVGLGGDRDLARRLAKLPPPRLRAALDQLHRIQRIADAEKRAAALADFRAGLAD